MPHVRTHDLDYRLMGIGTQGRALIQSLGMAYDFVNDITSITDTAVPGRSQAFTYDANQRLLTATGAYGARGYAYDADGNRTGESFRIGRETNATAYAMAATSNRLTAITGDETRAFAYDAAGNLLTDTATTDDDRKDWEGHRGWRGHGHKYGHDRQRGKSKDTETRAYTYDSRGRNIAVTITEGRDRKTFTYLYNAMGQRVAKTGTHFIYDLNGNLIAETDGRRWKDYIYIDSMPVAMVDNNDLTYIHTDHLGAAQKMTDDRQRIVWDRVSEPFGETAEIKGNVTMNLRFPGQYHDEETGLDYNYFRSYDPTVGRYTQSDPIGLAGGINTFSYVGQNPVNFVDPWGLEVQEYSRPIDLNGPFSVLNDTGIEHRWIKTNTYESGMGPAGGNVPGQGYPDMPGSSVGTVDHTGQSEKSNAKKVQIPFPVNEQCVNKLIKPGQPLGHFVPGVNDCHTFDQDVLSQCRAQGPMPQQSETK